MKTNISTTKTLTFSAICLALAVVLGQIPIFQAPFGGSVSPMSMFFITFIGYLFGAKIAIISGIAMGLLNLSLGGWIFHPMQVLLDYPLAFGALGLSGLFKDYKYGLYIGFIVGALSRFVFHFLSGRIFFYTFAPEGWNYSLYSAVYNISYIGIEMALTLIIISLPPVIKGIKEVKSIALNVA
jgi:thiamine transporter